MFLFVRTLIRLAFKWEITLGAHFFVQIKIKLTSKRRVAARGLETEPLSTFAVLTIESNGTDQYTEDKNRFENVNS